MRLRPAVVARFSSVMASQICSSMYAWTRLKRHFDKAGTARYGAISGMGGVRVSTRLVTTARRMAFSALHSSFVCRFPRYEELLKAVRWSPGSAAERVRGKRHRDEGYGC
jgi:hypothetical protein